MSGRRAAARGVGAVVAVLLATIGHELSAQPQGPIKLFPELAPEEVPAPGVRPPPGPAAEPPAGRGAPEAEPPDEITVEGLAAPQIDAIGLSEGLDADLWTGSTPEVVLALIGRLPVDADNPPLRALARRLLGTGATFARAEAPGRVLTARVERLLMVGALGDAGALLEQLPNPGGDTRLARRAAEVALWRGDVEPACGLANDAAAASGAPFWIRIGVFCRLQAGDVAGAQLAQGLLRDAGGGDPLFLDLAEGLAAGDVSGVEITPPLDALHVAMLRAGRGALPQAVLDEAPPPLLAAALSDPALAPVVPPGMAERAFALGVIDVRRLREIYASSAPPGAAEPLDRVRSAPGPEARALAYEAVTDDPEPVLTARLFDLLWRRTDTAERPMLGEVFGPVLSGLSPREDLLFAAPSITPALLIADRPAPALRWFGFLRQRAATDAGAREAAHALAPLFGLAGLGEGDQVPRPDHAMFEAWQAAMPDAELAPEALYALFDGLGTPVPLDLWWQSSDAAPATAVTMPPPSIWRTLARAREEGRTGEVVAAALALLGTAEAEAPPEATVQGLGALRQAGFGSEARSIALASAVLQGF